MQLDQWAEVPLSRLPFVLPERLGALCGAQLPPKSPSGAMPDAPR